VAEPTVAIVLSLQYQVPPLALVNVTESPWHKEVGPEVAGGKGFTVNTFVVLHPNSDVYVIIVIPDDTPVTIPLELLIPAIPELPEDQLPPVPSVSVLEDPTQTFIVPEIANGNALTVKPDVATQPALVVNVIIVVPGLIPDTVPLDDPIVAMLIPDDIQVPDDVLLKILVEPIQTFAVPEIAAGNGLTVTIAVAWQPVASV